MPSGIELSMKFLSECRWLSDVDFEYRWRPIRLDEPQEDDPNANPLEAPYWMTLGAMMTFRPPSVNDSFDYTLNECLDGGARRGCRRRKRKRQGTKMRGSVPRA